MIDTFCQLDLLRHPLAPIERTTTSKRELGMSSNNWTRPGESRPLTANTHDSFLKQRELHLSGCGLIDWMSAKEGPKLSRAAIASAQHFKTRQRHGHFSHVNGLCSDTYHAFHSCQS
jgi:hypothetical protein